MKLNEFIDFENGIPPAKGCVLLAEPFLQDAHFERSIVFMCEHSEQESYGFVLNHPMSVNLDEFMDIAPKSIPVFHGGPVASNSLFYLHTWKGIEGSEEIIPGLFFGGDLSEIFEQIQMNPTQIKKVRFFIGYSGWSDGQLEQEIKERAWICANNVSVKTLMNTPVTDLWKTCMSQQGNQFQTFALFPKNVLDN